MRKFKFLLFAFVLAGAAFTSCSKDDLLDAPEADKPVVTVNRDGASITTINDKDAGEIVPVAVHFAMGAQDDRLNKIKITTVVQGQSFVVLDSTLSEGMFNRADKSLDRNYNIAVGQTPSAVTFETQDVDGRVGSVTINVAPKGTSLPEYNVSRVVLLAGQLNTAANYGGFYSVSVNKVFKLKDAVTNSQLVDIVYYYGNTNAATITSISDPLISDKVNGPAGIKDYMDQFNVRNATMLASATATDWEANSISGVAVDKFSSKVGQTQLKVGSYIAFKTVLGYNGLIRVDAISGSAQETRSITLGVKIVK